MQAKTQKDFIVPEIRDILFFNNNENLKESCNKNKKVCLLGLLDGRKNKLSEKEFKKHIKTLEGVANKKLSKNLEFGWVNATCQTAFSEHFNGHVSNLPGVVALLPQVEKYAIMYGSFEKDNLLNFVDKLLNGKVPLENFANDKMFLENTINCEEIVEETPFISGREEEDTTLKEVLEEVKNKREEFEEEREKLYKNKNKKKSDL